MTVNSAFVSGEFVQTLQAKIEEYSQVDFPNDAPILVPTYSHSHDMTEAISRQLCPMKCRKCCFALTREATVGSDSASQMNEQLKYVLHQGEYDAFGSRGSPLLRLVEDRSGCEGARFLSRKRRTDIQETLQRIGCTAVERGVTDILARVSSLVPQKSLRASFTRLFKVVFILNLVQPSHVLDCRTSVREELSLQTVVTLLRMRVDFNSHDVTRAIDQLIKADAKATSDEAGRPNSS
ncbi:unnamed protein product [Peronospora destructor]|uniref:Uncharacterized protein n=1 Tax=Peronospora destructor TaxID=86335 RepID=A0AAV0V5P4_9STRA|nr:unnamed protein product [Peronospora destructor]